MKLVKKTSIVVSLLAALQFLLVGFIISTVFNMVEDGGGIRKIIVDTGKEVKSVVKEISEE